MKSLYDKYFSDKSNTEILNDKWWGAVAHTGEKSEFWDEYRKCLGDPIVTWIPKSHDYYHFGKNMDTL